MKLSVIQNANLNDKLVLVRVDHNVVENGVIHDPYRIDATFQTLFYIASHGGKLILMTHIGRPKNKKDGSITISDKTSVLPIVEYLYNKLNLKFKVPDFYVNEPYGIQDIDTSINNLIKELKSGTIDGIYLPNTRWFRGEEDKGEWKDRFAKELAGLADIYVNDAFGSWQPHVSTFTITKYLPSYAGLLLQKEINNLDKIFSPAKPMIAVIAGAKFDTKINSLKALIEKVDYLMLGGVILNAYLAAKYNILINGIDDDNLALAKDFVDFVNNNYPNKIIEPRFIVESDTMDGKIDGHFKVVDINTLKAGDKLNYVLDVAPESFSEPSLINIFNNAKTFFVNAVMGFAPYFNDGTIALNNLINSNAEAMKLYAGGDTLQELKRLLPGVYMKALDDPKYYMFTGGGAVLNAIEENSPFGMEPVKALLVE